MSRVRSMRRLNIWLWQSCRRLNSKQQQGIVYLLSGVYLLLSVYMIAQLLTPECEALVVSEETLVDSPIEVTLPDSLSSVVKARDFMAMETDSNSYGNRQE